MKQNRLISTAVLLLLLGAAIPALAQKGEEEKGGAKAQPAQHQAQPQQRAQKAQPQQGAQRAQPQQRAQKAQPQRAQQAQRQAQPQRTQQAQRQQPQRAQQAQRQAQPSRGQQTQSVASNRSGGQYGRISNANYTAHFGHGHSFHMGRPRMSGGYNRFQYGGYSFGYNQGWPVGWGYNDDFYVEYLDGVYYLCDLRFPGVQITLNIF